MLNRRYKIHTDEGYKEFQARVAKGEKYLEGHWLDPKYRKETELFEALAMACLEWELEHDLIKELL